MHTKEIRESLSMYRRYRNGVMFYTRFSTFCYFAIVSRKGCATPLAQNVWDLTPQLVQVAWRNSNMKRLYFGRYYAYWVG